MFFDEFGGESSEMGARDPDVPVCQMPSVLPFPTLKKAVGETLFELTRQIDPGFHEKLLLQCITMDMLKDAVSDKNRTNVDTPEESTEHLINELLEKIDSLEKYNRAIKKQNEQFCILFKRDNIEQRYGNNQRIINQLEKENEALKRENKTLSSKTMEFSERDKRHVQYTKELERRIRELEQRTKKNMFEEKPKRKTSKKR